VYQVTRATKVPVIGIGGISTGEDALEYLLVGARAVQIGTANLYDPAAGPRIVKEISGFLSEERIDDVNHWIGSLKN
jgi:dihydroorotate dehydrogenase (NAD+) catalytic subunit